MTLFRSTMAKNDSTLDGNIHGRTKVKTGCATCRIRKVKCDESKPSCQRCVKTGRKCDGYSSLFKLCTNQPVVTRAEKAVHNSLVKVHLIQPTLTPITRQDVELLDRCFSVKTIFDVKLGCDKEAQQVLQASLTSLPVRHAVWSLRALREDLEASGDGFTSDTRQSPSHEYGLRQYNLALRGAASNLSCPGSDGLRSALLCCQVFISIEQLQGNYASMAQHIVRGLRIMHEYRARPYFTTTNKLVLAHHDQLPLLDVFIIKLFAAPCKFADPSATTDAGERASRERSTSPGQESVGSCELRKIAPDMRTELTRLAALTLEFLNKVSQIQSTGDALRLLLEKASLLYSLESWVIDLEIVQAGSGPDGPESISVSFMRIFYLILKIILLGALDSSPDQSAELQTEDERLQGVARHVSQSLRAYKSRIGPSRSLEAPVKLQ